MQQERTWFIFDELGSLQQISELTTCLAESRKYGGAVTLGIQNLGQLDEIYGPNITKAIVDLCSTKACFRQTSPELAQRMSKALGEKETMGELYWKCKYDEFEREWHSLGSREIPSMPQHKGRSELRLKNSDCFNSLELLEEIRYDIEYIRDGSYARSAHEIKHLQDEVKRLKPYSSPQCEEEKNSMEPYCYYSNVMRSALKDIDEYKERQNRSEREYAERMNIYSKYPSLVQNSYLKIFNDCLAEHQWNGAYFSLGFLLFQQGDFFSSMGDISQYIKGADKETLSGDILKAKYHLGTLQNILGKYTEAIDVLSQVIADNPENKEAYLERSIAFFEQGNFDQALKDYIKSEIKPTKIDDSFHTLEFSGGIVLGLCSGAEHTLENFVPSMLCSLQGLANGIWAFTANPKEVSVEMIDACKNIYGFFSDQTILESLKVLIPEVREICDWQNIPDFKKGELIGSIVGKYGLDIFLTAGAAKGIKAFHELRKANAIMTLESMTTLQKAKALEEISGKWNNNVVKELDNIKSGALRKDKELYKKYKDQVLNETQVRKILHEAGFQTFDRPKNIPRNWTVEISQRQGGMRYNDPTNNHNYLRVMPGEPNSPNLAQRKPYVKHTTPKGCLNKNGQIVSAKDPSAHIPLDEYNFDLLTGGN